MWKRTLRRSWQQVDDWYNVFFAYAEGGLRAVRAMWREFVTYKLPPGKPKSLVPEIELLEGRQMPTAVQFSASEYTVAENAASVTLKATLDASSASNVTVHYATSDATAVSGTDYTNTSGTLTITAGTTNNTFTVAIANFVRAANVHFTVTLSSPTNATLGNPAITTVDILEPAEVRSEDPRTGMLVPVGETQVDVNMGSFRLSQPLDFDLSPGTDVGGNPALVYNSGTVSVRPIIQVPVYTDPNKSFPTEIDMRLTWNGGTPQSWTVYSPSGSPGDIVVGAVQLNTAVAQTGYYSWLSPFPKCLPI
jgi:hypothetical protein